MKVTYHTFGCKANQYDTERMRQEIEARGARTVPGPEDAHLVVLNTCTVTGRADAEARRYVHRMHREHPDVKVLVVGCSAALRSQELRRLPIDGVVAGHDPVRIANEAATLSPELVQLEIGRSLDEMHQEPVGGSVLLRREGASRGWLKIQDGCDRKCSFCATRLARGASRSRSPEEVVREARQLSTVHPELVLTGIHIGHYGRDLESRTNLSSLVATLLDRVPDVRFRLGSIEATEVDDRLVALLEGSSDRLAPHLHMPLQSGADPVLKAMRRWHTRRDYLERTEAIAGRLSVFGLGADIITGFPGETEADHRATVDLVESLPYTYLHVFPFAPRPGTAASREGFASPVPQRVAGDRSRELRESVRAKAERYERRRDGAPSTVVLEGDGKRGLTGDYLQVPVAASASDLGVRVPLEDSPGGGTPSRPRLRRGRLRWTKDRLAIDLTDASTFN